MYSHSFVPGKAAPTIVRGTDTLVNPKFGKGDNSLLQKEVGQTDKEVHEVVQKARNILGMFPQLAAELAKLDNNPSPSEAVPPPAPAFDESSGDGDTEQREVSELPPEEVAALAAEAARLEAEARAEQERREAEEAAAQQIAAEEAARLAAEAEAAAAVQAQAEAEAAAARAAEAAAAADKERERVAAEAAAAAAAAAEEAARVERERQAALAKERAEEDAILRTGAQEQDLGQAEKRGKSGGLNNPGWKVRQWRLHRGLLTYSEPGSKAIKGTIGLKGATVSKAAPGTKGADKGVCLAVSVKGLIGRTAYLLSFPDEAKLTPFLAAVEGGIKWHEVVSKRGGNEAPSGEPEVLARAEEEQAGDTGAQTPGIDLIQAQAEGGEAGDGQDVGAGEASSASGSGEAMASGGQVAAIATADAEQGLGVGVEGTIGEGAEAVSQEQEQTAEGQPPVQ